MDEVMEVGAFEAKTHFSELMETASSGRVILVTKRGEPMVRIVPARDRRGSISSLLKEFESIRASARPGPSAEALKKEGRR